MQTCFQVLVSIPRGTTYLMGHMAVCVGCKDSVNFPHRGANKGL